MGNSVVTEGGGGWVEVEEGIRRINGNGKIQQKLRNNFKMSFLIYNTFVLLQTIILMHYVKIYYLCNWLVLLMLLTLLFSWFTRETT